MTDLYNTLFETFNSISKKDVQNGSIAGQKSIYSNTSNGSLERAVKHIHENEKQFSNQIKQKRDIRFRSAINLLMRTKREDFDNYSGRLSAQLSENGLYGWDPSILRALVDLISYAYLSSTKEKPQVYSDIQKAKSVTQFIFNKLANVIELKFPSTDIQDQFKIAVLATLYNINAEKEEPKKPEEKKPEATPTPAPTTQPVA
jgi:hypothetical protein